MTGPADRKRNLSARGKPLLLLLGTLLACWILLESLFFCCVANLFPYAARLNLGFGPYVLLQQSKAATEPRDYIAIFGDSYAFGAGDWFMQSQQQRHPRFHVTHVLHEQLGRDIVTFGIPGSSNVCGFLEDPISAMTYINATWRYSIDPPDDILLFFYEGNDISDNWLDIQARYLANGYRVEQMADHAYFNQFVEQEMLAKNTIGQRGRQMPWYENLFFSRFAALLIRGNEGMRAQREAIAALQPAAAGKTNQILIDGKTVPIPDGISAPPIEMPTETFETSVQFLASVVGNVRTRFPTARISLVYLPAVSTTYRFTSPVINFYQQSADHHTPASLLTFSDGLCQRVRGIAEQNGIGFDDARAPIAAAGRQQILHGPLDWSHFNEAGYRALAGDLADFLATMPADTRTPLREPCTMP